MPIFVPSSALATRGSTTGVAPEFVAPNFASRVNRSLKLLIGEACQTKQVVTSELSPISQVNLSGSKRTASGLKNASNGIAVSMLPITVPSRGASE